MTAFQLFISGLFDLRGLNPDPCFNISLTQSNFEIDGKATALEEKNDCVFVVVVDTNRLVVHIAVVVVVVVVVVNSVVVNSFVVVVNSVVVINRGLVND